MSSFLHQLTNFRIVALTQSDSTVYEPPLRGIDVFAPGDVSIVAPQGDTITLPFPSVANGGSYPYRYWCPIRQVRDTGTAVADADLRGIRG